MKIVRVVLSFLLLATFAGVAGAEDWPTRKLRIVVPFPAGGSGDVQVRISRSSWRTSQGPAGGSPPWR
jgi:tripartite-type tricarboxylate transporter receptor subunit TctC